MRAGFLVHVSKPVDKDERHECPSKDEGLLPKHGAARQNFVEQCAGGGGRRRTSELERRLMDHHEFAPGTGWSIGFSVVLQPLQSEGQSVGDKRGVGDELRLNQEFYLRRRTQRREGQLENRCCFLEPTN